MEIEIETENETEAKDKKYDEYEIKECAQTILKAEEIKADPEKMKLVSEFLNKQKSAIDSVVGGKKITSMKQLKEKANKA